MGKLGLAIKVAELGPNKTSERPTNKLRDKGTRHLCCLLEMARQLRKYLLSGIVDVTTYVQVTSIAATTFKRKSEKVTLETRKKENEKV